jgi:hypothetical protein
MIERSVQIDGTNGPNAKRAVRPTDLPTENRQRRMRHGKELFSEVMGSERSQARNFPSFFNFSTIVPDAHGGAQEGPASAIPRINGGHSSGRHERHQRRNREGVRGGRARELGQRERLDFAECHCRTAHWSKCRVFLSLSLCRLIDFSIKK